MRLVTLVRRSINFWLSLLLVGCTASPAATLVPTPPPTVAATPMPTPLPTPPTTWLTHTSTNYPLRVQYPPTLHLHEGDEFRSDDNGYSGFFVLRAGYIEGVSINGVCAGEAYQLDPWYGRNPEITSLTLAGYPACMIISSEDQDVGMKKQSAVMLMLPQPIQLKNNLVNVLIVLADRHSLPQIAASLKVTLP